MCHHDNCLTVKLSGCADQFHDLLSGLIVQIPGRFIRKDQLRVMDGIEWAIFLYETGIHQFKVSLRSNSIVDVSRIAAYFGGGGPVRAAGCTMSGSVHDVVNNLSAHIAEQLEQEKANA